MRLRHCRSAIGPETLTETLCSVGETTANSNSLSLFKGADLLLVSLSTFLATQFTAPLGLCCQPRAAPLAPPISFALHPLQHWLLRRLHSHQHRLDNALRSSPSSSTSSYPSSPSGLTARAPQLLHLRSSPSLQSNYHRSPAWLPSSSKLRQNTPPPSSSPSECTARGRKKKLACRVASMASAR